MDERMVTVRIRDDYHGHRHRGELKNPGDEFETSESTAEWLLEIGAIDPYEVPGDEPKRRTRARAAKDEEAVEAVSDDHAVQDDMGGFTTTEG